MGLIDDLLAKLHEPWSAAKHNGLVKLAQQNTLVSGPGVRQRRTPFGTFISFDGGDGGSGASTFFRPTIKRRGDQFEMRFALGLIGGVKPTIAGQPIDKKGDDKKFPALIVKAADFDPDEGVAAIYFRVTVDHDFAVEKAEPIAAPSKPEKKPWTAHKLAGFLFTNGKYDRHLFSDLGLYAANRKESGFFDPIWSWTT